METNVTPLFWGRDFTLSDELAEGQLRDFQING
jgi:hypothetical protein